MGWKRTPKARAKSESLCVHSLSFAAVTRSLCLVSTSLSPLTLTHTHTHPIFILLLLIRRWFHASVHHTVCGGSVRSRVSGVFVWTFFGVRYYMAHHLFGRIVSALTLNGRCVSGTYDHVRSAAQQPLLPFAFAFALALAWRMR